MYVCMYNIHIYIYIYISVWVREYMEFILNCPYIGFQVLTLCIDICAYIDGTISLFLALNGLVIRRRF